MISGFSVLLLLPLTLSATVTSGPFDPANVAPTPIHIIPSQSALLSPNKVNQMHYHFLVDSLENSPAFGNGGVLLKVPEVWRTISATEFVTRSKRGLDFGIIPLMGQISGMAEAIMEQSKKMRKIKTANPSSKIPTSTPPPRVIANPKAFSPSPTSSTTANTSQSLVTMMNCLNSSATDVTINSLLFYGGAGATVLLCPSALILLSGPVFFYAANQTIATQGYPRADTRATLKVTGANQTNAIYGSYTFASGCAVRNIQVDGSRDGALSSSAGLALIEMGGQNTGQIIDNCHVFEPRGWSCLHGVEGFDLACSGMKITNNQIGPAGHAPTGPNQFKRGGQIYPPGQWADGISIACRNSFVGGNVITDTTDGGIVVFGAPGSIISGNTIVARERLALGGINQVDWSPFRGSFLGTIVENNFINSESTMIKVGIAVGNLNWGTDNRTVARVYGGTTRGNTFSSGIGGYFGFSISLAGAENTTILDNSLNKASYGGVPSGACFPLLPNPLPQPFIYDPYISPGAVLQRDFVAGRIILTICNGPGAIRLETLTSG